MTGFVDRVNPANQSIDHNLKLPTWQGKATVMLLYSLSKQYYLMQCLLNGGKGQYAEKA